MAERLGDRLRHIHLTDGTGSAKDEHLVPGRGTQPVVELLEHLAGAAFGGHIVVEINTRKAGNRDGPRARPAGGAGLHAAELRRGAGDPT